MVKNFFVKIFHFIFSLFKNFFMGIWFVIYIISKYLYLGEKKVFSIFIPKKKTNNNINKEIQNEPIKANQNIPEVKDTSVKVSIQNTNNEVANTNIDTQQQENSPTVVKETDNSDTTKRRRKNKNIERQAMSIDFDSDDVKKSEKKQTYVYEAKNPDGKFVKGKFDAYSKVDVHSFLMNEGYEIYAIKTSKWINFLYGSSSISKGKYSKKELIFFLTQLSTYLRSGIALVDAIRIFAKQEKKDSKKKILQAIVYELVMGESFSNALDKQGNSFPKLLVNMIKTAEMTGELPDTLDDMANYYEASEKTRKQMISAMTYPSIVFIMSVAIITFIMIFVIPQFVDIYNDINATIPGITLFVISASNFLGKYWLYVFGGLALFIITIVLLYKKIKAFRTSLQYFAMHLPVFGNIIIYNEVTMFTKTFGSLINHNVFITDSMDILSKITNNEIYRKIIYDTMSNLSKGESISTSFKDHWAFPIVAYEMLLTGERTGELGKMMEKVSVFYQEQHNNLVTQMKSFIEPIMISFLALIVGGLLLAVIVPMFSLYNQI